MTVLGLGGRRKPQARSRAALTIDVDSLRFYRAIHGGAAGAGRTNADELAADPIYTRAMPRFWELVERHSLPATLFLIGADAPAHARAFAPVLATGSEVASHSFAHDYRLSAKSRAAIDDDLEAADAALVPLNAGRPLRGFRAPGYTVSANLLEAVADLGYAYDSSLLPSPEYFAARFVAVTAYAARGRPSASMYGDPRQFAGPLDPYRPQLTAPWRVAEGGSPLLEIPIACEPRTRVPLIGTSWVLLPETAQRVFLRCTLGRLRCVNVELHAIDLLDQSDDPALAELAVAQADLRTPASKKLASLDRLFAALAQSCEVLTLAGLADSPS